MSLQSHVASGNRPQSMCQIFASLAYITYAIQDRVPDGDSSTDTLASDNRPQSKFFYYRLDSRLDSVMATAQIPWRYLVIGCPQAPSIHSLRRYITLMKNLGQRSPSPVAISLV